MTYCACCNLKTVQTSHDRKSIQTTTWDQGFSSDNVPEAYTKGGEKRKERQVIFKAIITHQLLLSIIYKLKSKSGKSVRKRAKKQQ